MSLSHIQRRRRHKVIARDIGRLARRLTLVEEEIIAVKRTRKGRARTRTPSVGFGSTFFERGPLPPLLEVLSDLHFHTHLLTFYSPNCQ